ncbi:DinB family protein [Streptomyces durocortorensis]|uniref:DinB family protein n=1 Tax=Streptomyces durocortorensis TaxID=2811104 RepID=A0ABS2HY52_9ACTN|nr:DinB family protein [Streptomyces durocortorensis]MBM7055946.1 DinB family protein [Streptomyces durocortorensis]
MNPTASTGSDPWAGERQDLLAMVADQRTNFLYTVAGLTDEQARARSTVSELTPGGLVKHLADVQRSWLSVIDGTAAPAVGWAPLDPDGNRMTDDETLAGHLDAFHAAAEAFDRTVREEPDLGREVTLPRYPWSPPEPVVWTVRHVLLHVFREIAHHSGHADIVREALDGASTTEQMAKAAMGGE